MLSYLFRRKSFTQSTTGAVDDGNGSTPTKRSSSLTKFFTSNPKVTGLRNKSAKVHPSTQSHFRLPDLSNLKATGLTNNSAKVQSTCDSAQSHLRIPGLSNLKVASLRNKSAKVHPTCDGTRSHLRIPEIMFSGPRGPSPIFVKPAAHNNCITTVHVKPMAGPNSCIPTGTIHVKPTVDLNSCGITTIHVKPVDTFKQLSTLRLPKCFHALPSKSPPLSPQLSSLQDSCFSNSASQYGPAVEDSAKITNLSCSLSSSSIGCSSVTSESMRSLSNSQATSQQSPRRYEPMSTLQLLYESDKESVCSSIDSEYNWEDESCLTEPFKCIERPSTAKSIRYHLIFAEPTGKNKYGQQFGVTSSVASESVHSQSNTQAALKHSPQKQEPMSTLQLLCESDKESLCSSIESELDLEDEPCLTEPFKCIERPSTAKSTRYHLIFAEPTGKNKYGQQFGVTSKDDTNEESNLETDLTCSQLTTATGINDEALQKSDYCYTWLYSGPGAPVNTDEDKLTLDLVPVDSKESLCSSIDSELDLEDESCLTEPFKCIERPSTAKSIRYHLIFAEPTGKNKYGQQFGVTSSIASESVRSQSSTQATLSPPKQEPMSILQLLYESDKESVCSSIESELDLEDESCLTEPFKCIERPSTAKSIRYHLIFAEPTGKNKYGQQFGVTSSVASESVHSQSNTQATLKHTFQKQEPMSTLQLLYESDKESLCSSIDSEYNWEDESCLTEPFKCIERPSTANSIRYHLIFAEPTGKNKYGQQFGVTSSVASESVHSQSNTQVTLKHSPPKQEQMSTLQLPYESDKESVCSSIESELDLEDESCLTEPFKCIEPTGRNKYGQQFGVTSKDDTNKESNLETDLTCSQLTTATGTNDEALQKSDYCYTWLYSGPGAPVITDEDKFTLDLVPVDLEENVTVCSSINSVYSEFDSEEDKSCLTEPFKCIERPSTAKSIRYHLIFAEPTGKNKYGQQFGIISKDDTNEESNLETDLTRSQLTTATGTNDEALQKSDYCYTWLYSGPGAPVITDEDKLILDLVPVDSEESVCSEPFKCIERPRTANCAGYDLIFAEPTGRNKYGQQFGVTPSVASESVCSQLNTQAMLKQCPQKQDSMMNISQHLYESDKESEWSSIDSEFVWEDDWEDESWWSGPNSDDEYETEF